MEPWIEDRLSTLCRAWSLEALALAGRSATSVFFTCRTALHGEGLLKLRAPDGPPHERGGFAYLARQAGGPAVRIHAWTPEAAFMERVMGARLLDRIDEGRAAEAAEVQIGLTLRLLDRDVSVADLTPLNALLRPSLSLGAAEVPEAARPVLAEAQAISKDLLADRTNWRALHGDLHPRNILRREQGWCAIDALGLVGPPAYDFANLFINPWDRAELIFEEGRMAALAGRVSAALACDRREVLAAAIAHALFHLEATLAKGGRGRHPAACLERLMALS